MRKKVLDVIDELKKLLIKQPKGPLDVGFNTGVMATINEIKRIYKIKGDID